MKLEVGRKYKRHSDIVEVKFVDCDGDGWGLSTNGICKCVILDYGWEEVTDKPDPGEGWRLLEPDEEVHVGDEWFGPAWGKWIATVSKGFKPNQYTNLTFRRRIAPQYVPYTWDDREELRGRWYRPKDKKQHERQVTTFNVYEYNFLINGWTAERFLKNYEWIDGSPCGKRVV
jgi:hypothetical protein